MKGLVDDAREVIYFDLVVGERAYGCEISFEALASRFGAKPAERKNTFQANADEIRRIATHLIEQKRFGANGRILIKSVDCR